MRRGGGGGEGGSASHLLTHVRPQTSVMLEEKVSGNPSDELILVRD